MLSGIRRHCAHRRGGRRGVERSDDGGRERGAVVVEAAILLPVIALLLFGLVEFGLIFKDELTVSNASGSAARAGAAIPKQPDYQDQIIDELNGRLAGTGLRSGDELVIFRAEPDGLPENANNEGEIWSACGTATADCTRYEYDGSAWVQNGPANWTADEQNACRDSIGGIDQLGVYLSVTHDYITGFIGVGTRQVTNRAVYALEPLLPGECEPT